MLMKREQDRLGIEWRKFYRTVIALVVPMALQNLINVGVTAADVIMLGAVGEDALSLIWMSISVSVLASVAWLVSESV